MMNVYLDSNVLYDALFAREPFNESAWQILSYGTEGKIRLAVSTLTIVNAVYVAKKYDIPIDAVKQSLLEMHRFISFIDLTEINIIEQLSGNWKDFEDAIQHYSAIEDFSDVIVTRNEKDFSKSEIIVMSPSAFLNTLETEK